MDRGAWWATVHRVAKNQTREATEHACLHVCAFCVKFVTADVLTFSHSRGVRPGNPLQYSRPENPMDRGAWWATVHRVAKNQTLLK